MPSNTSRTDGTFVRCLTGKLIGARTEDLRTKAEWEALTATFFRAVSDFAGRPVVCADLRQLTALDPDAYAHLVEAMRRYNDKLLRSALIVSPSSPAGLRIESALRDANNSARRICTDAVFARAWLSSSLDVSERVALEAFLGGYGLGRRSLLSLPAASRKPR